MCHVHGDHVVYAYAVHALPPLCVSRPLHYRDTADTCNVGSYNLLHIYQENNVMILAAASRVDRRTKSVQGLLCHVLIAADPGHTRIHTRQNVVRDKNPTIHLQASSGKCVTHIHTYTQGGVLLTLPCSDGSALRASLALVRFRLVGRRFPVALTMTALGPVFGSENSWRGPGGGTGNPNAESGSLSVTQILMALSSSGSTAGPAAPTGHKENGFCDLVGATSAGRTHTHNATHACETQNERDR